MFRPGGMISCGKQTFPAPVSLMGAVKLMLKLVVFTPSPRLTKIMAAASCRVKLSEPPVNGQSVLVVVELSLIPAPVWS